MIDIRTQLEAMPLDPLAVPGVVRLLLSVGASRILQESGEDCFMIAGKCSYPSIPDRWAILLKPVPKSLADQACGVLLGTHRATRIRHATTPPPPADGTDTRPARRKAASAATGTAPAPSLT